MEKKCSLCPKVQKNLRTLSLKYTWEGKTTQEDYALCDSCFDYYKDKEFVEFQYDDDDGF